MKTKKLASKILALSLALVMIIGMVPLTVVGSDDGGGGSGEPNPSDDTQQIQCHDCADGECAFVKGASCMFEHEEDCSIHEGFDCGCNHEHDTDCGYIEAVECDHICDEACESQGFMGIMALAAEGVPYITADGSDETADDVTVIDAEFIGDTPTAWGAGWYVAQGMVNIEGRVTVTGAVNLILADDAHLIVEGGIQVQGANSLTIWAQSHAVGGDWSSESNYTSVGKLTATAGDETSNAGIGGTSNGGNNVNAGGNITINGGVIVATGGSGYSGTQVSGGGAGIGGSGGLAAAGVGGDGSVIYGSASDRTKITINNGKITATGGTDGPASSGTVPKGGTGAGIGGGGGNTTGGAGGNIEILGGNVTATGGADRTGITGAGPGGGAGIGGGGGGVNTSTSGGGGASGTITITNAVVTAAAGDKSRVGAGGAGIGGGGAGRQSSGGWESPGGAVSVDLGGAVVTIRITNSTVTARGADGGGTDVGKNGMDIGSGGNLGANPAAGGNLNITGGSTVTLEKFGTNSSLTVASSTIKGDGAGVREGVYNASGRHNVTVALTASPSPGYINNEVTLTAELHTTRTSGFATPEPTSYVISFKVDGTEIGTDTLTLKTPTETHDGEPDGYPIYVATTTWTPTTANSYSITAAFTGDSRYESNTGTIGSYTVSKNPITAASVTGVEAPAKGQPPVTTAPTAGAATYTAGEVSWNTADTHFRGSGTYTATVILTAAAGYTFGTDGEYDGTAQVNSNSATSATVSDGGDKLTLTYEFTALAAKAISGIEIETKPNLTYTHGDALDLSAMRVTIAYDDGTEDEGLAVGSLPGGIGFAIDSDTVAANVILSHSDHDQQTLTISNGTVSEAIGDLTVNKANQSPPDAPSMDTRTHNSITLTSISGAQYRMSANGGSTWGEWQDETTFSGLARDTEYLFRAYLPEATNLNASSASGSAAISTAKEQITGASVTVTAPSKGNAPSDVSGTSGVTTYTAGVVTWNTTDEHFLGGGEYTATVTLTANDGYTFGSGTYSGALVNGTTPTTVTIGGSGATLTLTYEFTQLANKEIASINVTALPNLTYTHGNTLDLSAMRVTITYDDGTTDVGVAYSDLLALGVTLNYTNGLSLVRTAHDGQNLTISGGDISGQVVGALTVDALEVTVTPNADQSKTYGEADPTFLYTFSPELLAGDSFTGALSRTAGENVGTYAYTLGTLTAGGDYTLTLGGSNKFEITPATLTITDGTVTAKPYDGTDTATVTSVTFSGEQNGETLTFGVDYEVSGAAFADANAATGKTVTATVALLGTAKANNYVLANTSAGNLSTTGQINKASGLLATAPANIIIVSSNTTATTYDLTSHLNPHVTAAGVETGTISYEIKSGSFTDDDNILDDTPTLIGATLTYTGAGEESGTATIVIVISCTNYASIERTITFEATAKTIVDIKGLSIANTTYTGLAHAGYTGVVSFTLEGTDDVAPLTDSTLTVSYKSDDGGGYDDDTPPTDAGEYSVLVTLDDDPNYIGEWEATFTIAKKTVTVKADDKTVTRGAALPEATVSYTGFIGTDNEDNALGTKAIAEHTAVDTDTAGTFDIEITTDAVLNGTIGANYVLEHEDGTLTVRAPAAPPPSDAEPTTPEAPTPGNTPAPETETDFVQFLYLNAFGREPDSGGFDHWMERLESGELTGVDIMFAFVFSEEAKNLELDDEDFVTMLYRTFFGRMPDEGGFAHWLSRLNAGEAREAIFAGFANSVEFDNLCQAAGIETGSFSYSQTTANLSLVFERNAGTHRRK